MRQDSHYLLALCSPKGMNGYCGHTHNDFLSFELEVFGRTFLSDCGSYVYTQSPEWRNRFRSTTSHNTLTVDNHEQNYFNPKLLFEIESAVRPEVKTWRSMPDQDLLEAAYTLILPDGSRVTHERRFIFLKTRGHWIIHDRVLGTGRHTIETRFHFAEDIRLEPLEVPPWHPLSPPEELACMENRSAQPWSAFRTLCTPGPNLFLATQASEPLSILIGTGWISQTYAAKNRICVLQLSCCTQLPYEQVHALVPAPLDVNGTGRLFVERASFLGNEKACIKS
jgi:hypothetical protein